MTAFKPGLIRASSFVPSVFFYLSDHHPSRRLGRLIQLREWPWKIIFYRFMCAAPVIEFLVLGVLASG